MTTSTSITIASISSSDRARVRGVVVDGSYDVGPDGIGYTYLPGLGEWVSSADCERLAGELDGPKRRYMIQASGMVMGVYLGVDELDALDDYAQDTGADNIDDLVDTLGKRVEQALAELSATEIDSVEIEVDDIGQTDDGVEADVTIRAARLSWCGSVTLHHDPSQPAVAGRHPLGTCGAPLDGWAGLCVREAMEVLDQDLAGEIVYAVDEAARALGF